MAVRSSLALLVFAACHLPTGQFRDAGDSGSVTAPDGGLADAGPALLTLAVSANPNSVLSAAAAVQWTGPLTSLRVLVSSGATEQATPWQTVTGDGGSLVVPLFPLRADTNYSATATATDAAGRTLETSAISFTTGALPTGLPVFNVADGGTASPGVTLIALLPSLGLTSTDCLTIVDGSGAPVWYYTSDSRLAGDFQQQPDGTFTVAVMDSSEPLAGGESALGVYRQIDVLGTTIALWTAADVPSANPPITVAGTDNHDIRLQPNGDALLFGLVQQTLDLTAEGGQANAEVLGDVLERVTPAGSVTFSWNAFTSLDVANIDPAAATVTGPAVDFTHANAIDVLGDGNYLVGLRNLSQVLKIDSTTGEILWKLGGTDGQFTFVEDPLNGFSCQHGVRALPNGHIILFDDGDGHTPPQSRAVEYELDTTAMTATLVWSAEDDPPLYAEVLGYAQRLANGNTLVSYGSALHVQEVDMNGQVLWDLTDPGRAFGFYRAYRLNPLSALELTTP